MAIFSSLFFRAARIGPQLFSGRMINRIMISPAVMEMGGIMVTPSEADFNRLDAPTIESIYREVSLIKE